ncbi:MAG TPA: Holliday junction branch migration protein RuvA, partial [Fimbriimonas sp.]|nr:Holliday junction branch migration protein RuvA [Fimbriimonas sp.]
MIGFLRGSVMEVEGNLALIDVQGVGYEVVIADSVISKLVPGTSCSLFTRQIFREDGVTLCGFLTKVDRLVFDMLLDVKGCGPKVAQALIGQVGTEAITRSILAGDTKTLSSASGVGPRLAERIIVELRPKVESGKAVIGGLPAVSVTTGDRD